VGITYEKTWQFDMNRAYDPGVGAAMSALEKYTLWYCKAFLTGQIGGATQGLWTVAGSSDGVTGGMDGVDRWGTTFDPAKVVGSVSARSWVVLQSPSILGKTYWVLLDWNSTVPGTYDAYLTLKMDVQAPTGGSATVAPTMATGLGSYMTQSGSGNQFALCSYASPRPGPMKMHGMLATDGSFIILSSRDYTGAFFSGFVGMVLANCKAADQYPFYLSLTADITLVPGTTTGFGYAGTLDNGLYSVMRIPTGTASQQYLYQIKPVTTRLPDGPDIFDGAWMNYPFWVGDNTVGTNRYRTIRGRLPDIMVHPGGNGYSSKYPVNSGAVDSQNNPTWMLVGDLWMPTNAIPLL
jgi:hypothetical protein